MTSRNIDTLEVTELIHAGAFDSDLHAISTAITIRRQDLGLEHRHITPSPYMGGGNPNPIRKFAEEAAAASAAAKKKTLADFKVGDKVVVNSKCGTKYLVGEHATVKALRRTKLSVVFDRPLGRFKRTLPDGTVVSSVVVIPLDIIDHA